MKDRIYKVTFDLRVSGNWVEDGLYGDTVLRRIKDELPGMLCPYANGNEVVVKTIKVTSIIPATKIKEI